MQVLNEGKLKHLVIINFTNNCRNLLESRQLASLVATLACNNLVLVALLANKNWLKHTILLYRVSKLCKRVLVKVLARLTRVANNLFDWKRCLRFAARLSIGFANQSIEASSKSTTLSHDESPL